ncbi:MAG: exopolyphosphatase / guanosine-5-triphosphate,3-diphosphate pyrophosphatase [Solirubrobacteraceae bacterium]|nr:exopolyphosphatase / guanosine-5-triphosphate,3-diphosphate pyrophosphatase [Solirubrobacteraceae bacterium]
MRCACIDIGSNTTRLLVADGDPGDGRLRVLAVERVFTAVGAAAAPDGTLPPAKIAEVVAAVAAQAASARRHGAGSTRAVATAAIRRAPNRDLLVSALARAGIELEVLTGEQEARLAFAGAIASGPAPPTDPGHRLGAAGSVAVIDVGGGSTEVVVGRPGSQPGWWASLPVGSSSLTVACVAEDPPSPGCLAGLHAAAAAAFAGLSPPPVELALAVGGSATSLLLLAGPTGPTGPTPEAEAALDDRSLGAVLAVLTAEPVAETARRLGLHPERVRVMPAGVTLLARASRVLGAPLRIARGGLREGVILDLLGPG